MDDDPDAPKRPAQIVLGEDLSRLSIDELAARIGACESEIVRIKEAMAAKQRSQAAASSVFRL